MCILVYCIKVQPLQIIIINLRPKNILINGMDFAIISCVMIKKNKTSDSQTIQTIKVMDS